MAKETMTGEESLAHIMQSGPFLNIKHALKQFGRDEATTDWRLVAEVLLLEAMRNGRVNWRLGDQ